MSSSAPAHARRHIPYLSFHKSIIREICRPQKDHLLIIAKGLGLRRVGWDCVGRADDRSCARCSRRMTGRRTSLLLCVAGNAGEYWRG